MLTDHCSTRCGYILASCLSCVSLAESATANPRLAAMMTANAAMVILMIQFRGELVVD